MAKPAIVIVPGFWEGPSVFNTVSTLLHNHGYQDVIKASLLSTGRTSPDNPTVFDDVQHVRTFIEPLVDSGKEVILVLHSAAGFIGAMAMEGLAVGTRAKEDRAGGVKKIVFLTAGVFPQGMMVPPLPCYDVQGDRMYPLDPPASLFHDLSPSEAESWVKKVEFQPASGWEREVGYCGWKDVPSVYLMCEKDLIVPFPYQQQCSQLAGSEIEICGAGHMVMLSQPEKVVEVIRKAAGETV